ncbi:MAG: hypothetical protein JXB19_06405 [Bacteroidales bacterium]|nr:hypothetical protein [Bacteroidales bacterium]
MRRISVIFSIIVLGCLPLFFQNVNIPDANILAALIEQEMDINEEGQLLFSSEMEGTTHQVDLSSFQKEVFFNTLRTNDFVMTRKIIKL